MATTKGQLITVTRGGGPGARRRLEQWVVDTNTPEFTCDRRDDVTTPWQVVHTPTGLEQWFGNRKQARRFYTSPNARTFLRACAQDVIDAGGRDDSLTVIPPPAAPARRQEDTARCAAAIAKATVQIAILAGVLWHAEPHAHCGSCPGWVRPDAGGWRHVNACSQCWTPETGLTGPCPELASHTWCKHPAPAPAAAAATTTVGHDVPRRETQPRDVAAPDGRRRGTPVPLRERLVYRAVRR